MTKAAFLDRDGVINWDTDYVHKIEDFKFVEEAFHICQLLRERGYQLFVITNQAGIGRGYYTTDDFHQLTEWMVGQLRKRGIEIRKVYFCPHHPVHGKGEYLKKCNCRKPEPGMLLAAKTQFNIDMHSSILIGDKESDIIAGQRAEVGTTILVNPKEELTPTKASLKFQQHAQLLTYLETHDHI